MREKIISIIDGVRLAQRGHSAFGYQLDVVNGGELADEILSLLSQSKADKERVGELERALGQIERMKLFPDDKINRTTLHAAIHVARQALSSSRAQPFEKEEGSSRSQPSADPQVGRSTDAEPSGAGD